MPLDFAERRQSVHLASAIDSALDLAETFGWRYAIPYLINERVPSPIIQRLLNGGGRFRRPASLRAERTLAWRATDADDMKNLFESLGEYKSSHACAYDEF